MTRRMKTTLLHASPNDNDDDEDEEEEYDDIDNLGSLSSSSTSTTTVQPEEPYESDLTGCTVRKFSLGYDIQLSSFAGSMGFDEVIDWEYFDNPGSDRERNIVEPPPFDPTKPKRTKTSSGSVVRLFFGEFGGPLGGSLRANGLDSRVLVKEYSGVKARELAIQELDSISKLQSDLIRKDGNGLRGVPNGVTDEGSWWKSAKGRYLEGKVNGNTRKDDTSLAQFMGFVQKRKTPYVTIWGQLDLTDYFADDDEGREQRALDRNEWYRALGVSPPKPGSTWIVYEYAGVQTLSSYSQPALFRRAKLPPTRGLFGVPVSPPPLPTWNSRARYVIQGIIQGTLEALADIHDRGIVHRSIGRNSILLSSVGQDKTEASNPYAVTPSRLVVKLGDFGFSGPLASCLQDEAFRARARGFGIGLPDDEVQMVKGLGSVAATGYAIAEDLHALGFVFLGLLLTSLAEPPDAAYKMPPTDEDQLQRLLGEIFNKNMSEFREYVEAEDIWDNVVDMLDLYDGAGWTLLEQMCFARERAADNQTSFTVLSARGLLGNPLLTKGPR